MQCAYCGRAPTIKNSHVVPRFIGAHIKANSPFGHMLNLWRTDPQYDLYKGPYLCASCDNQLFSSWERYFKRKVWDDPRTARPEWGEEATIRFLVSLAYRYSLHFLATSPIDAHRAYSTFLRNITEHALKNWRSVGTKLFIYPYVYRPITNTCHLLPGVNHLLSLAVYAEALPKEDDLPNAMLVIIPKLTILFCDGDLAASKSHQMTSLRSLVPGGVFDPARDNLGIPDFLKVILNRCIGQGHAHQKALGRWKGLAYGKDRQVNPQKICYVAQERDRQLLKWQRTHCRAIGSSASSPPSI